MKIEVSNTDNMITLEERSRLYQLEETIRQGLSTFVDVGSALLEIRDTRLYRQEYNTFEEYCLEQWNMKQSRAYQFMDSAKVIGNLQSSTIVELLPINESQARPLASLEPEEQVEDWFFDGDRYTYYRSSYTEQINRTETKIVPIDDVWNAIPECKELFITEAIHG